VLALSLITRLPDTSLTAALASGGRQHFGWGTDRHMLADLYDVTNFQTRVLGNWKKGKPPELPLWPRPQTKTSRAVKKMRTTVRSLYASMRLGK
jgi:hypothetical protein